jgi:SprT protein
MNEIQTATEEFWNIALAKFPKLNKFEMPKSVMNARLRTTGARSHSSENWIDYNQSLVIMPENHIEVLTEIVPHELAHNITDRLFPEIGNPHGNNWRYVYAEITGREASRTHKLKGVKIVNTIPFACPSKHIVYNFTPQRMSWVRRGKQYLCKTCNEILKPI